MIIASNIEKGDAKSSNIYTLEEPWVFGYLIILTYAIILRSMQEKVCPYHKVTRSASLPREFRFQIKEKPFHRYGGLWGFAITALDAYLDGDLLI